MARRSTVRRVKDFVFFDVLYEDGSTVINRRQPSFSRASDKIC